MTRFVAPLFVILCWTGCHAPAPSFNVLAPLGTTRVPPPGTTNYSAKGGSYYPKTAPTTTAPSGAAPATSLPSVPGTAPQGAGPQRTLQTATPQAGTPVAADAWRAPGSKSAVATASYNAHLPTAAPVGTGVAGTNPVPVKTGPTAQGMPVNDATVQSILAEPRRFQPAEGAKSISQLPPSSPLATAAVPNQVVSSAQASDTAPVAPAPLAATTESTLNWRTRPVASGPAN